MRIVESGDRGKIVIEFQDKYKTKVHTYYQNFKSGSVKNPYFPTLYGVGTIGNKYPVSSGCKNTKEYDVWHSMLQRCFDLLYKEKHPAYKNVTCCDEWLLFDNYYEWLHSQDNFQKWYNGKRWAVDKDIITKKNKIYCPQNCCLVPQRINCLFLKREALRGEYPIGVRRVGHEYFAQCGDPLLGKAVDLGYYKTPESAFYAYKQYKEKIIKQIAEEEFSKGNITKECHDAMMKYEVEITD